MCRWSIFLVAVFFLPACQGENEKGLPPDASDEARAVAEQCDDGALEGCFRLSRMLEAGSNGLAKDTARAAALGKHACAGGFAEACKGDAERYIDSLAAETGEKYEEPRRYAVACDNGGATACVTLGTLVERGRRGLPENMSRAVRLFARACELQSMDGCEKALDYLLVHELEEDVRGLLVGILTDLCAGGNEVACRRHGRCIVRGKCAARSDDDCRRTSWCADEGRCTLDGAECRARRAEDCAKSTGCQQAGTCTLVDGACAVGSDADCQRTPECAQEGLCAFAEGRCVARGDGHCRASAVCRSEARCWEKGGLCFDRDAQCKGSAGCSQSGLCKAGATEDVCVVSDCRASRDCVEGGRCRVIEGRCRASLPGDCETSKNCLGRNECALDGAGGCTRSEPYPSERAGKTRRIGMKLWLKEPVSIYAGGCHTAKPACEKLRIDGLRWRLPSNGELRDLAGRVRLRGGYSTNRMSGCEVLNFGGNFAGSPTMAKCIADL